MPLHNWELASLWMLDASAQVISLTCWHGALFPLEGRILLWHQQQDQSAIGSLLICLQPHVAAASTLRVCAAICIVLSSLNCISQRALTASEV